MDIKWNSDDEIYYDDPNDRLDFDADSDTGRSSAAGLSKVTPRATDEAIANRVLAYLDKCDAGDEAQSNAKYTDALYLYKDQRQAVVALEKKLEEYQQKIIAQMETIFELKVEIERLKSKCQCSVAK
ncbi:hypothetical protein BGX23_012192 [Mortierella sp. AD031]|nr:hypothetical protein BGX23_012192 [Mortierella sp. AD031]